MRVKGHLVCGLLTIWERKHNWRGSKKKEKVGNSGKFAIVTQCGLPQKALRSSWIGPREMRKREREDSLFRRKRSTLRPLLFYRLRKQK